MKVLVPIKRVVDYNVKVRVKADNSGVDLANVNFRYAIEGDRAPWRPQRAFDDGRQVFIEFPRGIGQGEMPPLFVIGVVRASSRRAPSQWSRRR